MIYQGPIIPSGRVSEAEAYAVLQSRMAYGWRQIAAMRKNCAPHRFSQGRVDAAIMQAEKHERAARDARLWDREYGSAPCYMIMPADGGDPLRK